MRKIYCFIMALLVLGTVASCNSDDDPQGYNYQLNMVTVASVDTDGAVFTFQAYDDSPMITLKAPDFKSNVSFRPGQRIMLSYMPRNLQDEATIKTVDVNGYIGTIFDSLRIAPLVNILAPANNPMKLKSIWRTGDFINLNCQLQYTGIGRRFMMIIDDATRYDSVIDAYIIDDIMGQEGYFYRRSYSSFFIGNAWNSPSCNTFRVHVNDLTWPDVKYYDFNKK